MTVRTYVEKYKRERRETYYRKKRETYREREDRQARSPKERKEKAVLIGSERASDPGTNGFFSVRAGNPVLA